MAHHRKAVIHKHVYELWIIYARAQVHCSNFFPRARILNKCQGYWKKGGLDIKIQWIFWFFFCEVFWSQDDIVFTKKNIVTASEAVCEPNWIFFQSFRFSDFSLWVEKMWWDILDDKVWHSIFSAMFSMLWEEIW